MWEQEGGTRNNIDENDNTKNMIMIMIISIMIIIIITTIISRMDEGEK